MKKKLLKNLSANSIQLIANQLFGFIIFYVLSTALDKGSFGQISLALALLMVIFNILSFGIDQLAVRKIAFGEDRGTVVSLYLVHVLATGLIFYVLLFWSVSFFPGINPNNLLLLIGVGKLAIYFSTPFKQTVIGMERFRLLAYMSIASNTARGCALVVLALLHDVNLHSVVIVFITGDILELILSAILFKINTRLPVISRWNKQSYLGLIRSSLPQFGVTVITSALARFDWILIGLVVSAVKLAEYSFAYKIFELSVLPLLALAPVLIPWITKVFKQNDPDLSGIIKVARIEMIIAGLTVLLLNVCWAPVIDPLTAGKYGAVNQVTIFILSLCIPLQYFTNLFWTIFFAKGQLKLILNAFIITLIVTICGDIILIPSYKNEGAAVAFLAGYIAQTMFYCYKNDLKPFNKLVFDLVICTAGACAGFLLVKSFSANFWLETLIAVSVYFIALIVTRCIKLTEIRWLRPAIVS
ncbi:MAG TPA: oligosaccharide flippase family protein [Mucilaginibacter sp.]|nr:oligosaccharide flippase family protein [Mucilaginibacter sp.]